jgi:hypothetical protein
MMNLKLIYVFEVLELFMEKLNMILKLMEQG